MVAFNASYSAFQSFIIDRLYQSGNTAFATALPDLILIAEAKINRKLRVRLMETSANVTITAQTAALPTGFMEAKRMYLDSSPDVVLQYVTPHKFWGSNASQEAGEPVMYTIEGENFVFAPTPNTTSTAKVLYWKSLTPLSTTSSGNTIFSTYPDVYVQATLKEGWDYFLEDKNAAKAEAEFERIVHELNSADIRDRHSGSPLVAMPDFTVY